MAASRRSPLMRDQWRADEDHRSYRERREQSQSDHRHRSPTSRPAEGSDQGLKIKGRAIFETSESDPSKDQGPATASKKLGSRGTEYRSRTEAKDERSKGRLSKELSDRHLETSPPERERSRKRTATPDDKYSRKKQQTGRSRSREHNNRVANFEVRHRDRAYSPNQHPRREFNSVTYSRPVSRERPILDSYVPSIRSRRSRSPSRNNPSPRISRRRSPSPIRGSRQSEDNLRRRQHSRGPTARRFERSISPFRNKGKDSRAVSPIKQKRSKKIRQRSISRPAPEAIPYKRKKLLSRSPERLEQRDSKKSFRSHHSSPTRLGSPGGYKEHDSKRSNKSHHSSHKTPRSSSRHKDYLEQQPSGLHHSSQARLQSSGRRKDHYSEQPTRSRHSSQTRPQSSSQHKEYSSKMQSSTRPIQSILDEQPRQPSPPRPIPSFDDANAAGNQHLNQSFPLHGMKSGELPSHNHRRIPPHIDTRQSYGTSPQYVTPTSSHHGSPQSGSPYSHGRGGWGGQQHYHGQSG